MAVCEWDSFAAQTVDHGMKPDPSHPALPCLLFLRRTPIAHGRVSIKRAERCRLVLDSAFMKLMDSS